jgi:hypothetical protein
MFRILYVSTANQSFSTEALSQLLQKARKQNREARVTGMLVYSDGDFLQVLEGEHPDVIACYDRISADQRHRDIIQLQRGLAYGGRLFPNWTMGFKRVPGAAQVNDVVGVNSAVRVRYLDAMSALDFLIACSKSQA